MPPKVKITRKDILKTAVDLVRTKGEQGINARAIAAALDCSTQPVFSNFSDMEALRMAVIEEADAVCAAYINGEMEKGEYPPYKASGMAYIRFAKEEKELFKLLYMRDRKDEKMPENHGLTNQMEGIVRENTGLDGDGMKLFHLEMWVYVHGIAAMFATGYLDLEWELVSKMLTDSYQGLRKQYGME